MDPQIRVAGTFVTRYGRAPDVVARAPGRVNLIGEHTDYNQGFVLPIAIDRAVWLAARARPDRRVAVSSLDFDETAAFDLDNLRRGGPAWSEYVKGVAWSLEREGHRLSGWEGVLAGDVPVGAGLSSSAALELAIARVFASLSALPWEPASIARLAQRAENEWVGVRCGIMDQMVSAAGRRGHALLIDCRSLALETVPLPPSTVIVVMDTATRRGLVESAYNERRAQCEAAALALGRRALRDVSEDELERQASKLTDVHLRRARHVVTEDARTLEAAAAMRQGDAERLGRLMKASHDSLRDDFEVSSPELNTMVACASQEPGCLGARMTGAGFGGSAVALVQAEAAQRFCERVAADYQAATGLQPDLTVTQAADGASLV